MDSLVLLLLFSAFLWFLVLRVDSGNSKDESGKDHSNEFIDGYKQGMRDGLNQAYRRDDVIDITPKSIKKRK